MSRTSFSVDRRNLARTAVLGAAAVMVLPREGRAQAAAGQQNVVFTETDPGHWDKVKALHVPVATVQGGVLTVKTPHPMSAAHYIVSHTVVLEGGQFLDRKTFTPADMPVSDHTLPAGYKGLVTVTSTCNLHDLWVNTISV